MNYFDHHIKDYAEATSHLTFVEDAALSRCIRKYYATEKPLPAEIPAVQRLVACRTKEEKDAVATVLREFFVLMDDGWHKAEIDEAIQRYQDGEPEREIKRANEDNRTKRHREERAALFKVLTDAGHHAPWNIGIKELRELVQRISAGETVTAPVTDSSKPVTRPVTAPATPVTATHSPIPNSQYPVPTTQYPELQPQTPTLFGQGLPTPSEQPKAKRSKDKPEPPTSATWLAYSTAYRDRYGVDPVRNATVNGQLAQLVARLGAEEAPPVAAFYLTHRNQFYVQKGHPVGLLLQDCEKLRTEWVTQRQVTVAQARQEDQTQTNLNAFGPLLAEARARRKAEEDQNAGQ